MGATLEQGDELSARHPFIILAAVNSACCEAILKKSLWAVSLVLVFSTFSAAQSSEIGVLAGGMFTSDAPPQSFVCPAVVGAPCAPPAATHSPTRIAYEGVFAHRLINFHLAGIHFELPVIGVPTRSLVAAGLQQDFSTVYVTPGVRLQVGLPFFSPFVAAGGGLAHYSWTASINSSTVGAFQVGGGFDFSVIPLLKFRAEVREFHNGTPNFNVGQNNVFAGAGLVLKF